MSDQVILTAEFTAAKGKEKEALEILKKLLIPTRAEPGCLSYCLYQDQNRLEKLMFHEIWANKDSFLEHTRTQHIQRVTEEVLSLTEEKPLIRFWIQREN